MTASGSRIAEITTRHVPRENLGGLTGRRVVRIECAICRQPWPCDASVLAGMLTPERLADELRAHRYGEDTEGVHGAWCACDQWDDTGKVGWADHAADAILAALEEQE